MYLNEFEVRNFLEAHSVETKYSTAIEQLDNNVPKKLRTNMRNTKGKSRM